MKGKSHEVNLFEFVIIWAVHKESVDVAYLDFQKAFNVYSKVNMKNKSSCVGDDVLS